jgi:membrane fusion protein (multidrug efflux system)
LTVSYISAHLPKTALLAIIISLLILDGCSPSNSETHVSEKRQYVRQENEVSTLVLKKEVFKNELVSNGKLKALRKSDLKFRIDGELRSLSVKNGQLVHTHQTLALLDQFEYRQQLKREQTDLKLATLELEDLLLGRGFSLKDSAKVPKDTYQMVLMRSGHLAAIRDLQTALYNLEGTVLKAPFSGKIANLKYNPYEQVSPGEVFCTIIDDAAFEVEFNLIETEIREIQLNDEVEVLPFSLSSPFKGYISEINPFIDKNGLILVKARVKNRQGLLLEGMNVKIRVEKEVPNLLVVPKSAVVLRQNQEVLFKCVRGKAVWTYIQTELENSESYTVKAHPDKGGTLQLGDTIIISGNLNLAHESEVRVKF